jgi:hypothetical protein
MINQGVTMLFSQSRAIPSGRPSGSRSIRSLWLFVAFVSLLFTSPLRAQTDLGTVNGIVTDATGALVPNATVLLTSVDSGNVRNATSNDKGQFSINALQRGLYTAHVEAQGFQAQDQPFELRVSQTETLRFTLQPGSEKDTVTVTDAAPVVDVSTSSTGLVVSSEQMTDMPLNGRNFTELALLTPGVTRGTYGSAASGSGGNSETFRYGETGGAALSVNGLRQQANNFELDGVSNNELLVGTIVFFPPVEATQEFRITTSVAPAQFGGAGGAIIQSSIKSGTNQYHGSAFFFDRDAIFDANPNYTFGGYFPFEPKPTFHRTQFGGTMGGPLWKDRLFMFGDYQGLRQEQPQSRYTVTVPTVRMRTGDFSEILGQSNSAQPVNTFYVAACNGVAPASPAGSIFNPVTCQPWNYGGRANVINPAQISKAGFNFENAFPLPNLSNADGTPAIFNNFTGTPEQVQRFDDFDVRLDANLTRRDTAFARFSYGQDILQIASLFQNLPAGFGAGYNPTHPRGVAAGETHTFSNNFINEVLYGYTRDYYGYVNPFENVPLSQNLGIPDANRSPIEGGLSQINSGFESVGDDGPYKVPQKSQQLADNVIWSHGAHTFRFGGDFEFHDVQYFQIPCAKGCFNFSTDFTGFAGADVLTGFADSYNVGIGTPSGNTDTHNFHIAGYGQDDWKITNRLTLNFGLRYELFTYPTEVHNYQSNFSLTTLTLLEAGVNGNSRALVNNNYKDLGPRLGFAYDLTGDGKSSVRGGYGLYYFQERGGGGNSLFNNADFDGTITANAYQGARVTLSGETPICPNMGPSTPTCNTGPYPPYLYNNNAAAATGPLPVPIFGQVVNPADPVGVSLISQDPHSPTSMVQQWNLQFQKQIDQATSFTIAYVGTKSDHLLTSFNLNTQELNANYNQFAYPQFDTINRLINEGSGNSHALELSINRNFFHGLQLTGSYTWSHALDDSNGAFFTGTNNPGNRIEVTNGVANINGPLGNYGNSDQDIRNAFSFSSLWYLPIGRGQRFGRNLSRPVNALVAGWQINVFTILQSGSPFDVTTGKGNANGDITFAVPNERADLTGAIKYPKKLGEWFDYTQFSPPPATFTSTNTTYPVFDRQGTVGRNQLYGPSLRTLDFSVFRYFQLTKQIKSQFRVQAYNLANTPQFQNPNGEVDPGFNIPTAGIDNGNASQITGVRLHSERQLELAFRVMF